MALLKLQVRAQGAEKAILMEAEATVVDTMLVARIELADCMGRRFQL